MAHEMKRSQFPDLLVQKKYFMGIYTELDLKENPPKVERVFKKRKSDTKSIRLSETAGYGTFDQVSELEDSASDRMYQGYDKTITAKSYSKYLLISRELQQDDQWNIVLGKNASLLKRAETETREVLGCSVLNNAFTTTCADGQYLIDTDHPYLDGSSGTESNKLASNDQLDVSSFNSLITQMRYTTDGRGKAINIEPKYLVIPEALRVDALQILHPGYEPGSANYTHNVAAEEGLEIIILPHLSSSTAWFFVQEPKTDYHPLIFFDRFGMEVKMEEVVKKNGATGINAFFRGDYANYVYRGIGGSTGA